MFYKMVKHTDRCTLVFTSQWHADF